MQTCPLSKPEARIKESAQFGCGLTLLSNEIRFDMGPNHLADFLAPMQ
jgi:hypothetical protein